MSRSEASGFLDQIRAAPEDDAPRLVYADWLDEHGDSARAEFIRVQIERANLPKWDARQVALRLREQALTDQYIGELQRGLPASAQRVGDWRKELPNVKSVGWGEFRRGFVATAQFATFLALGKSAKAAWAAAPIDAAIVPWPRRAEVVREVPPIPGLRELTIAGRLVQAAAAAWLAEAPVLSTIRRLTIADSSIGSDAFRQICRSPHLKELTALRMPYNSIGNPGIRTLVEANLPALVELDLSERGSYGRYGEDPIVDVVGCEDLAAWPGLARLHTLILNGNDVRREGLRALLQSKHITNLKHLALRGNGIDAEAAEEFESARDGLQLETLDLGENMLGDAGAQHLAHAECLRELKVLNIEQCELTARAVNKLAQAPFLATLRTLTADFNRFGSRGLHSLLHAKPAGLHTLSLKNNDLDATAADRLAAAPGSDALRSLDLSYNSLSDAGARALGKAIHLKSLLVLRLDGYQVSAKAAKILKESPLGKRLMVLEGLPGDPPAVPPPADDGEIPF
jgi:uncharacterized protein (TIGR02996 family)